MSLIDYDIPVSERADIAVGNINSGVNAGVLPSWIEIDCGSLRLSEYYGSFIDYDPHTKVELFLPHFGFVDLDVDVAMNNQIHIKYLIELRSGSGVAMVKIINNRYNNYSIYKTIQCSCTMQIPLSMSSNAQRTQAVISAIAGVGVGAVTGNPVMGVVASGVAGAMTSKNHVANLSRVSDASGMLTHKKPYIIIKRNVNDVPTNYTKQFGIPSNTYRKIGDCKGFTKIADCHVEIDKATDAEKAEILRLLKEGVVL